MWRRRRSRLLFCSQSRYCSSVRLALPSSPPTVAGLLPAPRRNNLSPAPTPTLTPPVRPAAPLAAFPAPHMASSAQSGSSSGGPAVPTVQRGIVKMVRVGPRTRTPLPPWSGSQALTPCPPDSLHGLNSPFLCPFLTLYLLSESSPGRTRHELPWLASRAPCHDSVAVVFVVVAFGAPCCYQKQIYYGFINGDSS